MGDFLAQGASGCQAVRKWFLVLCTMFRKTIS